MSYFIDGVDIERRKYARIKIEKPCILYASTEELVAEIVDISESGVLIKFNSDTCVSEVFSSVGNVIQFSSIDTYRNYTRKIETSIFSGKVHIVRCDGSSCIGCEFDTQDKYLQEYIKNKKITAFVNNGFRLG